MNKKTSNTNQFGSVILICLALLVGCVFTGIFPVKAYLVQSGSMEPSIMTGDIVVVKQEQMYLNNQVVTFTDSSKRVVTHRIIEKKKDGSFVTKGDANRSEDRETIKMNNIIGSVVLTIPKLGFLVAFLKTSLGMILLIILPALYLVFSEVKNISIALNRGR